MADPILINDQTVDPAQTLDGREIDYGGGDLRKRQVGLVGDFAGEGVGAAADSEATGDGSLIAVSKRIRTLLGLTATLAEQQTQTTALQLIDDAIHALDAAIGKVVALGAQVDDAATATVNENNVGALRMTPERSLHVELRSGAGEIGTSGTPVRTDPTGSTTQPVSGTVTANLSATDNAVLDDIEANTDHAAGTSALANVNYSTGSVTLQASNANRKGWTCYNDSNRRLIIKWGSTASATSVTAPVAPFGYYELPSFANKVYTGIITGIWDSGGSGAARVTELTV